jgi:hypothetical protein
MIVLSIVTANEMSGTVRFESYVYLCRQIIDNKEFRSSRTVRLWRTMWGRNIYDRSPLSHRE